MKGWKIGNWTFFTKGEPIPNIANSTMMVLHPIVRTPKWAIVVRHILEPNVEEHFHTHGFPYLTWIVKGGYLEIRDDGDGVIRSVIRRRFHFNRLPQTTSHRIIRTLGDTWTIGFHAKWLGKPEHSTHMVVDGENVDCLTYYKERRARA